MRDAADRVDDPWQLSDHSAADRADIEQDRGLELALLAYAQRSAARTGAEWFAAEFARREEEEQRQRGAIARWEPSVAAPDPGLVDASVEDDVVGGAPTGLGIAPPPEMRHPHVPRPPAPEHEAEPDRRRRRRKDTSEAAPAREIPGWANMSPGARRLYGVD